MSTKRNLMFKKSVLVAILLVFFIGLNIQPASAHCDSYDGPVLKDAMKALDTNNAELIKKWINVENESEVISLFNKTYSLKNGDKEIYEIVKTHFFETLVRLHRASENAPYTGLKPAGTTKAIIGMTDKAIETGNFDQFLTAFNGHVNSVLKGKYEKVAELYPVKNQSAQKGREYVDAYVDYTHSIEALHDIIEHAAEGAAVHAH